MQISRRQFFKIYASGTAGTTAVALGFAPSVAFAETRQYKLLRTRGIRNTCAYCFVDCGLLMYSLGNGTKNAKVSIFHIEGDLDHPVNRGALCSKDAGLMDFIHSGGRLKFLEYRAPGSDKWQQISQEEAFDRIVKPMREDRDANYIAQDAGGVAVNRQFSIGTLCISASNNETSYLVQELSRALGMLAVDDQAHVQHGSTIASFTPTFGRGVMTSHWIGIRNANLVMVMGGDAVRVRLAGLR